jgi:hypothetical protein
MFIEFLKDALYVVALVGIVLAVVTVGDWLGGRYR